MGSYDAFNHFKCFIFPIPKVALFQLLFLVLFSTPMFLDVFEFLIRMQYLDTVLDIN